MLNSALEHYGRQQRLTAAALVAARRLRASDFEGIAKIVAAFQVLAARDSLASIDPMLEEQDLSFPEQYRIDANSFGGTASDGRPLTTLFEQAASPESLALMVVTQVQDAARSAAGTSIVSRSPKLGYVRMLNPPSCGRCTILAGRFYRWNSGFQRHLRCDCRHVPSTESIAGDLTTDPMAYFDSLDEAGRVKLVGSKANAQAVADGADIGQVVNAYRRSAGMQVAGESAIYREYGIKWTSAGVTERSRLFQQQVGLGKRSADEYISGRRVSRMMPESIYANADSHAEAISMLRYYGWIQDPGAVATGRAAIAEARQRLGTARRRALRQQRRANRR